MMHERAGLSATAEDLIDLDALVCAYEAVVPDADEASQAVVFGTSGHRGSSLDGAFNRTHLLAIVQAVVDHRRTQGVCGPLFLARDPHALSEPAWRTAIEVLAGNDVEVLIDEGNGFTPTPAVSHAILRHNHGRSIDDPRRADGLLMTPSHNPPRDGGVKYNPPSGGPADDSATRAIANRANALIRAGLADVRRRPFETAVRHTSRYDFLSHYVDDLPAVLDLDSVRDAGVRIGVHPLGGAATDYWSAIADRHRLNLTVVDPTIDPRWAFMPLDADGAIRMDCSSPYAMAGLIDLMRRDADYDVAVGNDADADRHGIVTPDGGLMNPNHMLAAAIAFLFPNRPSCSPETGIGKTLVSSSMIDRVAADQARRVTEVPVGFKYFVEGLSTGALGFAGEESAGAVFLRRDGTPWSTDKDGLIVGLLAAEIQARTGQSASALYRRLTARHGAPVYARVDAPATAADKARLSALGPGDVRIDRLAGEPVREVLLRAPGDGAPIGGVKVVADNAWFAARPSGTEAVYKIYAESFLGDDHLAQVQAEARAMVGRAIGASSAEA
jgi:phosphoglucomutase